MLMIDPPATAGGIEIDSRQLHDVEAKAYMG